MEPKKPEKIKNTFFSKTTAYVLAGFGLVAALAWNDAIQTLFTLMFGQASQGGLVAKFLYAILVTIILALVSQRLEKEKQEQ